MAPSTGLDSGSTTWTCNGVFHNGDLTKSTRMGRAEMAPGTTTRATPYPTAGAAETWYSPGNNQAENLPSTPTATRDCQGPYLCAQPGLSTIWTVG